jgi:hypothetical protein
MRQDVDLDLPMLKKYNYGVKTAFYTSLVCLSLTPNQMKIVPAWLPVACKFRWFYYVSCDWRPCWYSLDATGGHSGTNWIGLATSCMQILQALVASAVQSRQFFWQARWENNYLNLKMKTPLKIWESTQHMCLIRPIRWHYVWSDTFSWDSSFKFEAFIRDAFL